MEEDEELSPLTGYRRDLTQLHHKIEPFEIGDSSDYDNPPPYQDNSHSPRSLAKSCFLSVSAIVLSVVVLFSLRMAWNSSSQLAADGAAVLIMQSANNHMRYKSLPYAIKASLYKEFMLKYHRLSENEEFGPEQLQSEEFSIFLENLAIIDSRNQAEVLAGGTAVHGITQFSDISQDEFRAKYLGYEASADERRRRTRALLSRKVRNDSKLNVDRKLTEQATGKVIVWINKYTTVLKDQGPYSTSWAVATLEQIESDAIRAGILEPAQSLSYEQIVRCVPVHTESHSYCNICGNVEDSLEFLENEGLALQLGDINQDGTFFNSQKNTDGDNGDQENALISCKNNDIDKLTIVDKEFVNTEADMLSYVATTGPLLVCLSAEIWSTYSRGILTACEICGESDRKSKSVIMPRDDDGDLRTAYDGGEDDKSDQDDENKDDIIDMTTVPNHCAQIVGINSIENYWIIRNSWGSQWGLNGYLFLRTGQDTCGVTYSPTFTSVSRS